MNSWKNLEHTLWQSLKDLQLSEQKILVGFSGGVDSLALLWALHRVKKQDVVAAYIHHGDGDNSAYRDEAQWFCQKFCAEHKIPFESEKYRGKTPLQSEEDFRHFRREALQRVKKQTGARLIALAHHREDLLETRLLRLIRGTGPQGLEAMRPLSQDLFRPFLKISKKDLQDYLKAFSFSALEDPSNHESEYLRNWLRREWLPALEARQAGAVQSLARSLETISEGQRAFVEPEGLFLEGGLSRAVFLSLSPEEQKQTLAHFLLKQDVKNFSQSHLEEIQKRLDNSQKDFTFRVCGLNWTVNAQQIKV